MSLALWVLCVGVVETSSAALSTELRPEPERPLDVGRALLEIPGAFVELAFLPLRPLIELSEAYRLDERLFDLVTNDARTFAAAPFVEFFSSSGVGFGAAMLYNDPLLSADRVTLVGLGRINGDVSVDLAVSRRLPRLGGRTISLAGGYFLDHDLRYYVDGERRLLRSEGYDVELEGQLFDPGASDFRLYIGGALRRRGLGLGVAPTGEVERALSALPAGFARDLHYPEGSLRLELDSRDSRGRTTLGVVASIDGLVTADLDGARTGGIAGAAQLSIFLPVLPIHRVLFTQLGVRAAAPFADGGLPLHQLATLGGQHKLRGYDSDRFLGRLAWWGTLEYRYKIFEEVDTNLGFSSALFFDVGQAADALEGLTSTPLYWSAGLGVRIESALFLLGRLQLGFSPEGVMVSVGIGELL